MRSLISLRTGVEKVVGAGWQPARRLGTAAFFCQQSRWPIDNRPRLTKPPRIAAGGRPGKPTPRGSENRRGARRNENLVVQARCVSGVSLRVASVPALHYSAYDLLACLHDVGILRTERADCFEPQSCNIPQAETEPLGVVVRPPTQTLPSASVVNSPRPGTSDGVVAADDVRRTEAQREQLCRIVQVADRNVVRKSELRERADASGQGRTALEDSGSPFRETPEGFRNGACGISA